MTENRFTSNALTRLTVHLVWITKYRYPVLQGEIKQRCRDLIAQICDAEDICVLKGVVSQDQVPMLIEYPPSKPVSEIVKRLKGRGSRRSQAEFRELRRRYWGRHFWAIGYGARSSGNVTDEMVAQYLEHHRHPSNQETGNMILEQADFQSAG